MMIIKIWQKKKDKEINNKPVYYKARKNIVEIVSMRMYVWERVVERDGGGEGERWRWSEMEGGGMGGERNRYRGRALVYLDSFPNFIHIFRQIRFYSFPSSCHFHFWHPFYSCQYHFSSFLLPPISFSIFPRIHFVSFISCLLFHSFLSFFYSSHSFHSIIPYIPFISYPFVDSLSIFPTISFHCNHCAYSLSNISNNPLIPSFYSFYHFIYSVYSLPSTFFQFHHCFYIFTPWFRSLLCWKLRTNSRNFLFFVELCISKTS